MHFVERIELKTRAEQNRARKLAAIGSPLQLQHKNKNGEFAIIHPCTDGRNAWQISRFDNLGPYGDSRRATYYEVALLAIEENFRKIVAMDGGY